MTGTKLWRLLDKGETFFWFRASVSIEKKIGRLNQSKLKLLKRYKLHSSFFLYLSHQSKGIVLNIKRKALISILQQKLLLEALQVIIRLQISFLRKGNHHHVLFC